MTPEERARADAITEEIARQAKARRSGTPTPPAKIPGISPPPAQTGHGLRYGLIFTAVALAHVVGFLAYQNHTKKKELEVAARIADAEAITAAEIRATAEAEAERLKLAFAQQKASPKIEYVIVNEEPAQRPQTQRTQVAAPQRPTPPTRQIPEPEETRDRAPEHATVALIYLQKKKRDTWNARATSTEQVTGWEGRYRTEFEIPRDTQIKNSSPRPRRFEVLTQETDGEITGIDVTTKGY